MDEATDNSDDRRKPWGWGIACLVTSPVLYLLSFGPVLVVYNGCPGFLRTLLQTIYWPIFWWLDQAHKGSHSELLLLYIEYLDSWH